MGLVKYQGKWLGPFSSYEAVAQRKSTSRWHDAWPSIGMVWILALVLSWLAGLGVVKLVHILVQLFESGGVSP
jgi:hypothetical protein